MYFGMYFELSSFEQKSLSAQTGNCFFPDTELREMSKIGKCRRSD